MNKYRTTSSRYWSSVPPGYAGTPGRTASAAPYSGGEVRTVEAPFDGDSREEDNDSKGDDACLSRTKPER